MPCFAASLAFFFSCFSLIERLGFFFSFDVRSPLGIVDLLVVLSLVGRPVAPGGYRETGNVYASSLSRGHSARSDTARARARTASTCGSSRRSPDELDGLRHVEGVARRTGADRPARIAVVHLVDPHGSGRERVAERRGAGADRRIARGRVAGDAAGGSLGADASQGASRAAKPVAEVGRVREPDVALQEDRQR